MIRLEDVLKTSLKRLEDVLKMSWRHFSRRFEDVPKTSWRCLEDVLETSSNHLEDILTWRLKEVLKTSCEDLWPRRIFWSWPRRLEDVFWRRNTKVNLFALIKTSWRRLHQDKCLLGYLFIIMYDHAPSFFKKERLLCQISVY